jgi:hypothetical protein
MDANGARQLAARIRAGVWMGMRVELVDSADEPRLSPGDRGIVERVDQNGHVVVAWDRGFTLAIDPERMPVKPLGA